jgi:DNA modification methylase
VADLNLAFLIGTEPKSPDADVLAGLRNCVVCADNLSLLPTLPAIFDLIYIDPPYFTGRDHALPRRDAMAAIGEVSPHQFTDRWATREAYLEWLRERVVAMRNVLRPNGIFLLHLDWHISHYAKVLCDTIFGDAALVNELIWYYQTGGASRDRFSRKHDTIFVYAKGESHYFDGKAVAIPRTAKAMKRARSGRGARIAATDTHKNPDDVLTVPALNPMATERVGYPTQKPIELLERLILALCPPAGLVGDFCCGSGTTLVAAKRLGRDYVGCDRAAGAVALAEARLAAESGVSTAG